MHKQDRLKDFFVIPNDDKELYFLIKFYEFEIKTVTCRQQLALNVFAAPDICFVVGNGKDETYYTFDVVKRCFMYRKPNNPHRNKWYEARGMMSHLKNYLKDVLPHDFFITETETTEALNVIDISDTDLPF